MLLPMQVFAQQAATNLVGVWVIDVQKTEGLLMNDATPEDLKELERLASSVKVTIAKDTMSIVTEFRDLGISGTNAFSLVSTSSSPTSTSASYRCALDEHTDWKLMVSVSDDGHLRFTDSNVPNPMHQFLWKKGKHMESSNQKVEDIGTKGAKSSP